MYIPYISRSLSMFTSRTSRQRGTSTLIVLWTPSSSSIHTFSHPALPRPFSQVSSPFPYSSRRPRRFFRPGNLFTSSHVPRGTRSSGAPGRGSGSVVLRLLSHGWTLSVTGRLTGSPKTEPRNSSPGRYLTQKHSVVYKNRRKGPVSKGDP